PPTATTLQPTQTIAAQPTVPPSPTAEPPTPTAPAASTPTAPPLSPGGWALVTDSEDGPAPAPRYDHSLVADPERHQILLFGGRGSGTFGDTWLFDLAGEEWREVQGDGPPARFGAGAVYDGANRRVLLVMGQGDSGFFNDVWAFDLDEEAWTQLKANTVADDEPRPRYGQSAALHKDGRVLISHGFSDQGRFDDTWAFDPNTAKWVNITPTSGPIPLKRCLHELAYDPRDDLLLMFGGCSSGYGPCPQGDLWALDLASGTWTELQPQGEKPSPRSNPSLAYDPDRRAIFLFGGKAQDGPVSDTWVYMLDGNGWGTVESEISPSPRSSQGTAYDPTRRRVYIAGGDTKEGPDMEVWVSGF
ncbi:MAG TPA: kelch repeat-containing protein, partial [Chloroflexia bacterium]|nr:kelch repeat-containing protein [Chloroflexia bacterium]